MDRNSSSKEIKSKRLFLSVVSVNKLQSITHWLFNLNQHNHIRLFCVSLLNMILFKIHFQEWSDIFFSFSLSPEIYHTVWRTWHLIACSHESWLNYQFSLHHSYSCSWMVRRICIMRICIMRLEGKPVVTLTGLPKRKIT